MLGFEIATLLATGMAGYVVNTNLFYDAVPADPDTLLAVLPYGGLPDEPNLGTGGTLTRLETVRFQVLSRGAREDSQTPQLKLLQARVILVAVLNRTLSGVHYIGIEALSPVAHFSQDANLRYEWSENFQVMKEPSTS